jgi:drug/metabolite transporter (DMT)-like permease
MTSILGDLAAIGSAFTWAVGGVLLRSQTRRVDAVTLNCLQYGCAALVFLAGALMLGHTSRVLAAPINSLLWVVGGSAIGMIGGDTLYVRSLARNGVARAFPITSSLYMLFAYIGAVVFLKESVTWGAAIGGVLIAGGITLIVLPSARQASSVITPGIEPGLDAREFAALAGVSLLWAIATMCLRVGMTDVDPISANIVRLPVVAIILLAATVIRKQARFSGVTRQTVAATAAAGALGVCAGSILFLTSLQIAGAARASILSSMSPLFAAPMSILFFRERVTWMLGAGTVLCVVGAAIITMG